MPATAVGVLDQEPNPGVFTANMAASSQAHGFPHAASHQQQAGGPLAVSQASQQDPPPIVAAPRDFLQAAMQARLLGQSLQVCLCLSYCVQRCFPLILPCMVMLPLHVMRLQHTNQLVKAGAPCV